MVHSRKPALLLAVFTLSIIFAQTEWTRYEGNPVLVPGGPGESTTVKEAAVLIMDSTYHMWYSATDHPDGWNLQLFYAWSPDGINWTKLGDGPVLALGPDTAWDARKVYWPEVIFEDSLFKMWYSARGADMRYYIGYAESPDGITWEKYALNPVLSGSDTSAFDFNGVIQPSILKIDGVYHMWYTGVGSSVPSVVVIQYATSLDGLTWERYEGNPVLQMGAEGEFDSYQCGRPKVLLIDGKFHMWYDAYDGSRQTVGYATSPDGVNWSKWPDNPVFVADTTSWEVWQVAMNDVLYNPDGSLQMWYQAGESIYLTSIGYATSQLATGFLPQTEWTRYEGNPILVPGGIGETTSVMDAKVVRSDSIYHMWYAASENTDGSYPQIFYASSFDGLNWTKLGDGPVLPRGSDAAWDARNAFAPEVMLEDGMFKMWYSGRDSNYEWHIGFATSTDGITWEKYAQNPVLSASDIGDFASNGVVQSSVLKIDGVYHMWCAGLYSTSPVLKSIHYATSLDGLTWECYNRNPVMVPGENDVYDSVWCGRPKVLLIQGQFHMWYVANDGNRKTIAYATSPDGIHWTKGPDNPVLVSDPDTWENVDILPTDVHYTPDGTLHLWYEAGTSTWSTRSIGYATSYMTPPITGDRVLSVGNAAWVAGDTAWVPVQLSESYDVAGIDFTLAYDTNVLTFFNIDTTALTADFLIASNETSPGTLAVAMAAPYSLSLSSESAVANIDFAISPDAAIGTHTPIRFLSAALADTAGSALDVSTLDGSVLVTRPGDLNYDGLISSADAVIALRIAVGAHDPTPREFAMADRDSNGVVEEIDALCLLQTAVGLGCMVEGGVSEFVVQLTRPEISGSQGTEVVIPLQISSAEQLAAGSLELVLPPDIVSAVNITPGDLLNKGFTAWSRDNEILRIGFLTAEGLSRADGVLLNMHLTLAGDLAEHELGVSSARLFDSRGRAIDLDIVLAENGEAPSLPGQYFLSPAWPNPFNPATKISFNVPVHNHVSLDILDILGRHVDTLVNDHLEAGLYHIFWDGRSKPAGLYFYRITAGEFTQTKKMLLAK